MTAPRPRPRTTPGPRSLPAGGAHPADAADQPPGPAPPVTLAVLRWRRRPAEPGGREQGQSVMMAARAWPLGNDLAGVRTAMITPTAMPALLPAHHRRVASYQAITKRLCRPPELDPYRAAEHL